MSKTGNLVAFQAGWFACILGAANGLPWVGVSVVAALFAVHLTLNREPWKEVRLGGAALTLGLAADSAVWAGGAIEFPAHARAGWPIPFWMPALWLNFAMTLGSSLSWLRGRYAVTALFGAVGARQATTRAPVWERSRLSRRRFGRLHWSGRSPRRYWYYSPILAEMR